MMMFSDFKFCLDKNTDFPGIFNDWYLYINQCLQGYGDMGFVGAFILPSSFFTVIFPGEGVVLMCGVWHLS